jgi:hypothetical protein
VARGLLALHMMLRPTRKRSIGVTTTRSSNVASTDGRMLPTLARRERVQRGTELGLGCGKRRWPIATAMQARTLYMSAAAGLLAASDMPWRTRRGA